MQQLLDCCTIEVLGGAQATQDLMNRTDFEMVVREKMAGVVIDISQNPERRAFSRNDVAKCFTTASILYAFQRDCVILPIEMMALQGHRHSLALPPNLGVEELKNLAGMGICLPNLALILLAFKLHFVNGFNQV